MSLILTGPPAREPVALADAKLHLRVDDSAEDVLIGSLVTAARTHLEMLLGRAFITQSWSYNLDAWPVAVALSLPIAPVQTITAVRTYDAAGAAQTLAPSAYFLDGAGNPPRLVRTIAAWPAPGRPANGIEIAFAAGYGSLESQVPAPLRQAILLLVSHWYENREPVAIGADPAELPLAVAELIAPHRRVRL